MSRTPYRYGTWQQISASAHRAAELADPAALRYAEAHIWLTLRAALGNDEGYRRAVEMGRELSTVPLPGELWHAPGIDHRDQMLLADFEMARSALADAVEESLGAVGDLVRMAVERAWQVGGDPHAVSEGMVVYQRIARRYTIDSSYLVPLIGRVVPVSSNDPLEPGQLVAPGACNLDGDRLLQNTRLMREGTIVGVGSHFAVVTTFEIRK